MLQFCRRIFNFTISNSSAELQPSDPLHCSFIVPMYTNMAWNPKKYYYFNLIGNAVFLFVCGFWSNSRIFHSYGDVQILTNGSLDNYFYNKSLPTTHNLGQINHLFLMWKEENHTGSLGHSAVFS